MRWKTNPTGFLEALAGKEADAAIGFVIARKKDILKIVLSGWCVILLMTFTMILTVRLAYFL